jgi:hypothetical protein
LQPDKVISEKELIKEIVTILKKQGGGSAKKFLWKRPFLKEIKVNFQNLIGKRR